MTQPPNKPKTVRSAQATRLGRRADIRLIGLYQEKSRNDQLIARYYTGFNDLKGKSLTTTKRTGVLTEEEANTVVEGHLEELRRAWDARAQQEGRDHIGEPPAAAKGDAPKDSMAWLITEKLNFWKTREKHLKSLPGYRTAANGFIKAAAQWAKEPRHIFTEDQCINIRDEMLAGSRLNSGGPKQTMRNIRFVLNDIPQFPMKLVALFKAPKRKRGHVEKLDYNFVPSELAIMRDSLSKAGRTIRGLYLLGANFAVHATDAANATCAQLREARDSIARGERVKNGNPFLNRIWDITAAWAEDMLRDPKAHFLYPELVFTEEELAKDPDINQHPPVESPEAANVRRKRASAAASALFDVFLRDICKIKRQGLSFRSFRHTTISEWEAQGVSRRVGMTATGQSEEDNYLGYVCATVEQLKSLGEITYDLYQNPERRRLYLLNLNQLYDELVRYIAPLQSKLDKLQESQNSLHGKADQVLTILKVIVVLVSHIDCPPEVRALAAPLVESLSSGVLQPTSKKPALLAA